MRYTRIFLINPSYKGARVKVVFSAGLGYITEALKTAGFEYDVLDMSLGYPYKILKKKIAEFNPDLIGVSMMTYRYKDTYNLIAKMKGDFPEAKIVTGGPHISLFREKVLEECPYIDFGVVLEGEETIIELCKGEPLNSIKGLLYRDRSRVVYNGDKPFIKNLDSIPFPKYEKFELDKSFNKRINALPIVSSRGCPFNCIYCPVKSSIGEVFRARSPENILQELTYWYERGYRIFSFADDNFTLLKGRVYKICELIKKAGFRDLRLSCDNGIRADKVDRTLLEAMKNVGFYRIALGVEAGNDKVLKALNKQEKIETIKRVIQDACSLGYEVDLFFLVGSPQEEWADLEDSFNIASQNCGVSYFYNIIPFPNTELFFWIEKYGRFLRNPEDYLNEYPVLDNKPLFETPQMPYNLRKKALRKAFLISRRTMRQSWQRRLSKLGFWAKLFSFIYTTKFVQDVLLRISILRKVIYKLAYTFMS